MAKVAGKSSESKSEAKILKKMKRKFFGVQIYNYNP